MVLYQKYQTTKCVKGLGVVRWSCSRTLRREFMIPYTGSGQVIS